MKRREMRIRIVNCLYQYLLTGKTVDEILEENIDLEEKDSIPFIVNNTVGVINNLDELVEKIEPHLNAYRFERLGYVEQAILLLAAYEMQTKSADKAVIINEAIEITKKYCDDDAPKFINGVLDTL